MRTFKKAFYFPLLFLIFFSTNLFAEFPDYPDTIPTSIEVSLNSTINGTLSTTADNDMIKFVIPANTYTNISISSASNFDSYSYIYDNGFNYVTHMSFIITPIENWKIEYHNTIDNKFIAFDVWNTNTEKQHDINNCFSLREGAVGIIEEFKINIQ